MAALKHDADGFLVGAPINPKGDTGLAKTIALLSAIKNDTAAIRAAMAGGAKVGRNYRYRPARADAAANDATYRRPSRVRQRDARGRYTKAATPAVAVADTVAALRSPKVGRAVAAAMEKAAIPVGKSAGKALADAATPAGGNRQRGANGRFLPAGEVALPDTSRDSRGRFASRGGAAGGQDGESDGRRRQRESLLTRFMDKFSRSRDSMSGLGDAAENIDPTAAAAKEVAGLASSVLSPVTAGVGGVLELIRGDKGEDEAVPWYRRIWKELRESNKNADEKGGRSMLGILAAVLMALITLPAKLGKSLLGGLLGGKGGLPGLGGVGGMGGGKLAKMGKFMRRAGPLAALFGIGKMLFDENDSSLTREQKNRKHWGTGGATVGTLLGGALGSLAGPIGTVVGASVGGMVGEKVGGWLAEVKWSEVANRMTASWQSASDWFRESWDKQLTAFGTVLSGMAEKAKAAGNAVNNAVKNVTGVDVKKTTIAAANATAAAGTSALHWAEDKLNTKNAVTRRALKTGADYRAGNIAGLNDAQTRALVASTAETESAGGKLDIRNLNGKGYVGRYQAGAAWLADAGLIKGGSGAVRSAMAKDGYKSEWKWAESGGMDRFLKNDGNWNNGMTLDKYMASADVQDAAFKRNSDLAYQSLMRSGVINASTPAATVAGLLKARHLSGIRGANSVAMGRAGPADANGTTARKYYDDVALDKGGYQAAYASPTPLAFKSAVVTSKPIVAAAASPTNPRQGAGIAPAKIPALPPEKTLLGSNGKAPAQQVVVAGHDIGQNLSDRSIAQLATGGMGAYTARN